jgi:hypothetical protein
MWSGLGARWITIPTAVPCSRWRRGLGRARNNSARRTVLTQIGRALRELGIGWIAAYSPQAKGRVERSFLTDQDRLIKELRLAKVKTMQAANDFLEKEYWPEWNVKFTRPASGQEDLHRPLAEGIELGSALGHVEQRVITNNYTFPYYGKHYQIAREDVQAGMKRQNLRVELWLNGELKGRYQGRYVRIQECGAQPPAAPKTVQYKEVRKDHNAGGQSHWMDDFWNKPTPPLWQVID